ncbi:MAG TPA: DUF559 domain-containing protein [Xanthobacteraceae bacterium]|nr:DUF559 domain-containing protein [Xanthobacteraceae bacterium]
MTFCAHHSPVQKRIRGHARQMRKIATDAESAMWHLLRDRRFAQYKLRRQVPFRHYVLDFVCFAKRVVVEIDGSQHLNSTRNKHRDALWSEGFLIRYWNNDVLQQRATVLEDLFARLNSDQG